MLPQVAAAQSVTASGPWRDLEGQYIKGDQDYGLTLCFEEFPANPIALEEVGVGNVFEYWIPPSRTANTDQRSSSTCAFALNSDVESAQFAEGAHTFRGLGGSDDLQVASAPGGQVRRYLGAGDFSAVCSLDSC